LVFDIEKFGIKYVTLAIEVFNQLMTRMLEIGKNLSKRKFKAFTFKV